MELHTPDSRLENHEKAAVGTDWNGFHLEFEAASIAGCGWMEKNHNKARKLLAAAVHLYRAAAALHLATGSSSPTEAEYCLQAAGRIEAFFAMDAESMMMKNTPQNACICGDGL